jgi:hypothetical protein
MGSWNLNPIFERYLGSGSHALVVVVALALLTAWTVSILFCELSGRRRAVLATLRFLSVVILILVSLRPERVQTQWQKQSATLAILIDRSPSMSIKDMPGGKSRWDELRQAFARSADAIVRLSDDLEIKVYAFNGETQPVELKDGRVQLDEQTSGDESAYGGAMREVLRREDGKRLVAFVLAGDGAQQTLEPTAEMPESSARQLATLQCPLYAVPLGNQRGAQQARDVMVESMPNDLSVFVKNELAVTGTLRISGYLNRDIPLHLVVETAPGKEEIVATQTYRATRDGEQIRYQLNYVPPTPGEYKITVRAAAQDGEVTLTNNELPSYLTVLAGGLRLLYIQGEIRPEQRFLRRALAASPDVDVTLITIHARDRQRWPVPGLSEYFEPGKFDVYILGDVDSSAFSPEDLAAFKQAIERGAGLLALGGWHSFRAGRYQNTPLAEVMPMAMDPEIDKFHYQKFDSKIDTKLHLQGPLEMRPAEPWGVRHFLMRLAPAAENMAAWSKLPPLTGANEFRDVNPGAQVLAEDQFGRPLLVAGQPGGRVLAFAGDSTWRWVMAGQGDGYRRFWRQAILWLAKKDEVAKGNVWVELDSRTYQARQRVTFAAGARSATGDPLPGAKLTAHVVHPDGTRNEVRLVRQGDKLTGAIADLTEPDTYQVEVVAEQDGTELGTDAARFIVYTKDRELSGITTDATMLAGIAEQTREFGGRLLTPEELPALFAELAEKPMQLEEKVTVTVTYWDRWWVFMLLVGLLSAEWFLRKKWRLV